MTLEILIIVAAVMFMASYWVCAGQRNKLIQIEYSYTGSKGPAHWRELFPNSAGPCQSPINIVLDDAIAMHVGGADGELRFSEEYSRTPKQMCIHNDGNSVTLYVDFGNDPRPAVMRGPRGEKFEFANASFRWGPNDQEGSEHTINYQNYAMELQAIYIKGSRRYCNCSQAAEDNAMLIISYLFQVSQTENHYLTPLILSLPRIAAIQRTTPVCPIPLFFIMPPFVSKYVSYCGSLTFPPCTEGVYWIVQTDPLAISSAQVDQFRKLRSSSGLLENNRRPLQDGNGREITFYI
ncbi:hypothetical protein PPYR_11067 [Photinus pyralis]|uniref:Alpha-carbonic anhydrase domain-containing protein n=2 Tax=Photinus pyralis TaxID=7054 RepID=A0A5N4AIA0_PHOPY|nr:carbonic anhydrase 1-like [Photinus pyralis]KAB0797006.1 hypothetical protein PPYR_11067 [Photinus pyralis]